MKIFSSLALALLLMTCLFGCKKDGDSPSSSIVGTWTFVNSAEKDYQNNILVLDTVYTSPDDIFKTVQFSSNNTGFTTYEDGSSGAFTYSYDNSSRQLVTDDGTYSVTTLTSSSLVLHGIFTEGSGSSVYKSDVTITCKR